MECPSCRLFRGTRGWRPSQWKRNTPMTEEYRQCKVCDGEVDAKVAPGWIAERSRPRSRSPPGNRAPPGNPIPPAIPPPPGPPPPASPPPDALMGFQCEMKLLEVAKFAKYDKVESFSTAGWIRTRSLERNSHILEPCAQHQATRYTTFAQGRGNNILTPPI